MDISVGYVFPNASNLVYYAMVTPNKVIYMWYTCTIHVPDCLWSVVAERSSAVDSSSGVVRMWVRIPAWPVAALVSLSKTLNQNCFVLRMWRKAVGPVCCVMHVKEPRTLIVKEKGLAPVFLDSPLEHPAGWICAHYKSSVLIIIIIINSKSGNPQGRKQSNNRHVVE